MTGLVDCEVYLDGELVASTAAEFYAGQVAALSGLKVSWGRSTTVDQPEPSSLSLVQNHGTADFLTDMATGRVLEVVASGLLPSGDTRNVMSQGDFEGLPVGAIPGGTISYAVWQVVAENPHSGAHAAKLTGNNAVNPAVVVVPPAPFSSDPTAWDAIPRATSGESWQWSAAVWTMPGAVIQVDPVALPNPDGSSMAVLPGGVRTDVQTGGWVVLSGTATIPASGVWVGLRIQIPTMAMSWQGMAGPSWGNPAWNAASLSGLTWANFDRAYLDDLVVNAPAGGTIRTVSVFRGRVTDMEAQYRLGLEGGTTQVGVTAKDFTADLANDRIGDAPWAVEGLGSRVTRILALAAMDVDAQIDSSIAAVPVTYRDVDSQPAAGLVEELAASVGAIAWSAVHDPGGAYYWLEDPNNRVPLRLLAKVGGYVVIVPNRSAPSAVTLTSSNVLQEPIRWTQDVSDVATRVDITWNQQGVDGAGKPETTERHVIVVDAPLEADIGQRGYSLTTQLAVQTDAERVAAALLARLTFGGWRVSGITWAVRYEATLSHDELDAMLTLLDGTQRIGRALSILNLPDWTPSPNLIGVYIEGGTYTYEDGDWVLELTVSSVGQGASATWSQLPAAWTWAQFSPAMSWADVYGVGAPAT